MDFGIHISLWISAFVFFGYTPRSRIARSYGSSIFHFFEEFLCHFPEKTMAPHSSVLSWRIPGTGEPGGLPSMGLHRVRHDWSDLAAVSFSTVAIPTNIPTNSAQGLPFLHFLANTGYLWSFWWQSFGQVWADFSLWFWFSFLWWLMMWASFHVPMGQMSVFFGKMSIQVLCPFSIVFC